MGILLGLLTALTWGGADCIARFATHRIGTLRSMLYMQLTGFLLLSLLLPTLGGWGHLADGSGWQPWAWGFLAGSFNAVSGLALYRAFEIGKMAVVAPLSASYPALTLLLSWMTGERLSMVRIAGIICTLVGVVVARNSRHSTRRRHSNRVDDPFDQRCAHRCGDPHFQAVRASSTRRGSLDGPGHGGLGYQRLCPQQSRNENGAGCGRHRP